MIEYTVKFEVFEGPLDLLLYLVRKQEVDISQISISRLASDFITYLEMMQNLDLDVTGEFIVMAATLLYLKSRELLPAEERAEDTEETEDNPKWDLIRKLLQYKRYKEASLELQKLESIHSMRYPCGIPKVAPLVSSLEKQKIQVSIFELIAIVNKIIKNLQARKPTLSLNTENWTVSGQMDYLLKQLQTGVTINLAAMLHNLPTITAIVTTFLALLELIRLGLVKAYQDSLFGEILVELNLNSTTSVQAIELTAQVPKNI